MELLLGVQQPRVLAHAEMKVQTFEANSPIFETCIWCFAGSDLCCVVSYKDAFGTPFVSTQKRSWEGDGGGFWEELTFAAGAVDAVTAGKDDLSYSNTHVQSYVAGDEQGEVVGTSAPLWMTRSTVML